MMRATAAPTLHLWNDSGLERYSVHFCCSVAKLCLTVCNPVAAAHQASLSITVSQSLLRFISIELVMFSNHLLLCFPLLLPSIFPSIRVSSNESALCIRWPKHWSVSFSISPSNEYWGLISFRIDCFDPLGVWRTHKSLLQLSALPERVSALFLLIPLCGTLTLHYIHFVLGGSIQSTLKSEVCCFWYWNSGGAGGPLLYLILLLLLSHFSRVRLCETPWTTAYQAPPSMGFSRQEYWSGLPLPSPSNPSHAFIPDCNFC